MCVTGIDIPNVQLTFPRFLQLLHPLTLKAVSIAINTWKQFTKQLRKRYDGDQIV